MNMQFGCARKTEKVHADETSGAHILDIGQSLLTDIK
jgi:hypothetical protein